MAYAASNVNIDKKNMAKISVSFLYGNVYAVMLLVCQDVHSASKTT